MSEKRTRTRTPNNKTTTGFRISDELWEMLQPLLPEHRNTHPLGGGRPRRSDRECADAILLQHFINTLRIRWCNNGTYKARTFHSNTDLPAYTVQKLETKLGTVL